MLATKKLVYSPIFFIVAEETKELIVAEKLSVARM